MKEFMFDVNKTRNMICKALLCLYAFGVPFAALYWGV